MITCGPVSDAALQGSAIKITRGEAPSDASRLSLVRILFTYEDKLEDLIYPVDQCNSFFVKSSLKDPHCRAQLIMAGIDEQTTANIGVHKRR